MATSAGTTATSPGRRPTRRRPCGARPGSTRRPSAGRSPSGPSPNNSRHGVGGKPPQPASSPRSSRPVRPSALLSSERMASIAKVEPLTTARALRGPFDYRIPREMEGVGVGTMLLVPFGRRRVLGVVVDVASESAVPPERLVEPISALESGSPAELVRLALRVAEDYCSTPARALALVLPPGTGTSRRAAPAVRARMLLVATLT